jgi:hypothetical protein
MATIPWKIRAHGDHCSLTGVPFADGEVFYSCLIELDEGEGFRREDYCEAAWLEVRSRQAPFSFWRSAYESKPESHPSCAQPLRPDDAELLLQQLMEQGDPATEKARYILALTLERKKLLHQVGRECHAGRKLLLYEHIPTGEVLVITDPEIGLDQVAEVEQEVRRWLDPNAEGETGNAKKLKAEN